MRIINPSYHSLNLGHPEVEVVSINIAPQLSCFSSSDFV